MFDLAQSNRSTSSGTPQGFVRIPHATFQVLQDPLFNTYVLHEGAVAPVLFGAHEFLGGVSSEDIHSRWENALFFVRSSDVSEFRRTIEEHLDYILVREDIPVEDRFSILQTMVTDQIEHSFRLINCNAAVEADQSIGDKISRLLQGSGTLPNDMFLMARHDYFTFSHLTNVASYSVVLAEQLGIRDPVELKGIAVGGLLHDVGKRLIPKSLLNKKGKLSDEEIKIIQSHPRNGYEDLCERTDLSHGQCCVTV